MEICSYSINDVEKTFVYNNNIYTACGTAGLKILKFQQEGISEHWNSQKRFTKIPVFFTRTLKINYDFDNITFTLFDITGRVKYKCILKQKSKSFSYNAEDLPSGIYFVKLEGKDRILTKKVIHLK